MQCYNTIFITAGCLENGTSYPSKLSAAELAAFGRMNIEYVCFSNLSIEFV